MPDDDEKRPKEPEGRAQPPAVEDLAGATVAHYRVEAKLGQGGMGVVYRARDARLGRDVALKVLPASMATDGERRARLLREARSAAAVNHPNIATVFDVGESDGRVYLAMELVEGTTLRERLVAGALPVPEAVRIACDIAAGLARAHEKGIVHRDLKPENVMLARDGGVKILDFGLAKLREPDSTDSALEKQETQTLEGRVMGTPGYMSPEQSSGRAVDARTDVYALGVVLHELLTGGLPGLRSGRKPIVDARLESVVARCLESAPENRWADAGALLAALGASGLPLRRRGWPYALAFVAALAVSAAGLSSWRRPAVAVPSPPPSGSSATPAPTATTYTDLPVPPSDVPEARAEYSGAMQALRDDNFRLALQHFKRAAQLDPAMAGAHLRVARWSCILDPDTARAEFSTVSSMRTRLTERDRVFLEALEPTVGRAHKDFALTTSRLEAASERWPNDVELLDSIAELGTARPESVVRAAERASALDPQDVRAFDNLGNALALFGRYDEARAALERGTAVAPQSPEIFESLGMLEGTLGRCEDMEKDERRVADVVPRDGLGLLLWAASAVRRPESMLQELVVQHVAGSPEPVREMTHALDGASVALLEGRFEAAHADVVRYRNACDESFPTLYNGHIWGTQLGVDIALELGDGAEARRLAQEFLARRTTWTRSALVEGLAGVDVTPWLARVAAGAPHAIDALRSSWIDEQVGDGAQRGLVWSYAWAGTALTREEALEALDAREHDPRLQPQLAGQPLSAALFGITDAWLGHVYLLAGRPADAVPVLRRAVAACAYLFLLRDHVNAQLDLADALQQTGDAKGACDAYGEALARWGHATPRSVSAEAARAGVKRLHCAP